MEDPVKIGSKAGFIIDVGSNLRFFIDNTSSKSAIIILSHFLFSFFKGNLRIFVAFLYKFISSIVFYWMYWVRLVDIFLWITIMEPKDIKKIDTFLEMLEIGFEKSIFPLHWEWFFKFVNNIFFNQIVL